MGSSDTLSRAIGVLSTLAFLLFAFRLLNLPITPFFSFACASALVIFIASSPRRRELFVIAAIAPALALAYVASGGALAPTRYSVFKDALAFIGLSSFFPLAFRALRRNEALRQYLIALGIPFASILTGIVLCLIAVRQPDVYDLFLYRFDAAFGMEASVIVARWFDALPVLRAVCTLVYEALPLVMVLVVALSLRNANSTALLFKTFAAAGIIGCLVYFVLPAAGPGHVFGSNFPNHIPSRVDLITTSTPNPVPRNCMPSLHFAWALLMLWNTPTKQRRLWLSLLLFLAFTALATLGLAEHYLVDLVVAFPFAASIQSACSNRWRTLAVTGTVTILWIIYLRFGLPAIVPRFEVVWPAAVGSIAAGWWVGSQRTIQAPARMPLAAEAVYTNA